MSAEAFSSLQTWVLWGAFAVSFAFGIVAQKTHFCTMGAISDIVNMGDWSRMRMWAMAVGVAIVGFHAMAAVGWIDPAKNIYTTPRIVWLSALVGGAFFGFGMVLASGCGSKTLVRLGAGSLKAAVVFAVMGLAAFATLRGVFAVWRVNTLDTVAFEMPAGSSLSVWVAQTLGWSAPWGAALVASALGLALMGWALAGDAARRSEALWAGIGIGGAVVAMWWVTGHLGFVAEHPDTLEAVYLRTNSAVMESLTFTAPMAYAIDWFVHYSDTSKTLTVGVVSVLGVVVGSWAHAMVTRSFRWEGFRDTQDTALHLVGAVFMGVGGVTAMGCTVGQGLSGLSALGLGSLMAVAGILLGALLGLRFQMWLLMRD